MSRCPIDLIANVSTTRDHCAGPGTEHCAPYLCSEQTRYESHQWGGGETGEECVSCGVHWQDCEAPCPPPGREVCSSTCGLDAGRAGDHWPEGVARTTGRQR